MIKAPMCLQELRRKLYAKAEAEPHWRFWGLSPETSGFRLGAVEYAVAARHPGAVQRLPGACRSADSPLGRIGPISSGTKQTGERSAGKPHAAFDAAGAGNGTTVNSTRARRGKLRIQTRVHLTGYRASPRPYR